MEQARERQRERDLDERDALVERMMEKDKSKTKKMVELGGLTPAQASFIDMAFMQAEPSWATYVDIVFIDCISTNNTMIQMQAKGLLQLVNHRAGAHKYGQLIGRTEFLHVMLVLCTHLCCCAWWWCYWSLFDFAVVISCRCCLDLDVDGVAVSTLIRVLLVLLF